MGSDLSMEIGKITRAELEFEDHGFLVLTIAIQGDRWGCCVPDYCLGSKNGKSTSDKGLKYIIDILNLFEVERISDLVGQYVKCEFKQNSICKIGHIIKNKWYEFNVIL